MIWYLLAALVLFLALAEFKTSRSDGVLQSTHPYRRMLWYIMPTRNEAVVYFDSTIDAENLLSYLDTAKDQLEANLTHAVVAAVATGLAENPKMNQFVVGKRLYAKNGRWVTFTMKRKKQAKKARLHAVKLQMPDGETFAQLVTRINDKINEGRSDKKLYSDKEFDLLGALPRPLLGLGVQLLKRLDHYNLLPASFIENDAMYCSVFVTNLGSLQMGAGFHHLFEWGTCPLFLMVGEIEERAVVRDGEIVVRKILPLRYSYDERIDDGLTARFGIEAVKRVLEDPDTYLGCLNEDGSDVRSLTEDAVAP